MSRAFVFAIFCVTLIAIALAVAGEDKHPRKDYGLKNAILKRARRLMKPKSESATKPAVSGARQDEYPQFPDYDSDPNALVPTHKDDPIDRVGVISAKKILKIVGISLLGLLIIPAILLIPLFPCLILFLILWNLPIVKLIDVAPPMDPNAPVARAASAAKSIILASFEDEGCIERISCQIGKRSGSYGRLMLNWLQRRFASNSWVKRISRGFEPVDNCEAHMCSNALIKRIL